MFVKIFGISSAFDIMALLSGHFTDGINLIDFFFCMIRLLIPFQVFLVLAKLSSKYFCE